VALPGNAYREQDVYYDPHSTDAKGNVSGSPSDGHEIELNEKMVSGNAKACTSPGSCTAQGTLVDTMRVIKGQDHVVEKRFTVDGNPVKIFDQASGRAFDYVTVHASYANGFKFDFHNNVE
jgi:hypothetical protein